MSNRISDLDPRMQAGANKYTQRCAEEGIPNVVLETKRLLAVQMAYYSRGRAPLDLVRAYYRKCGLWEISDKEASTVNTKTLDSLHLEGLAMDVAPTKDGKVWWDAPREIWLRMFAIAETECGLDACAAGKWQAWNWDWPHLEWKWEI